MDNINTGDWVLRVNEIGGGGLSVALNCEYKHEHARKIVLLITLSHFHGSLL